MLNLVHGIKFTRCTHDHKIGNLNSFKVFGSQTARYNYLKTCGRTILVMVLGYARSISPLLWDIYML